MMLLDDIFEMRGGYVLNFSNDNFGQFFSELGIDINASEYSQGGGSKGKEVFPPKGRQGHGSACPRDAL